MEAGALRLTRSMGTNISTRFWRGITLLVRVDMIGGIVIAAGLLAWMAWH
jgi:hypothetical protein